MTLFGRRVGRALLGPALLSLVLLAGCSPSSNGDDFIVRQAPPAKIDVNTPALKAAKAAAGIEDCTPGDSTNDLPAVTLPCFGGGPDVGLDTLKGPLVINLWQVTCGPCRHELPIYQQFAEKYAGRVSVLGIDYDDRGATDAMGLLKDTGVTYPQLADPQSLLAAAPPLHRIVFMPTLLLVDADGSIVLDEAVQIKSLGQLEDLAEHYLGVGE